MYHISDVKQFNRCPRLFLLSSQLPKTSFQPFVRLDEAVTDLVIQKFGLKDYYLGVRNDPKERALAAMNEYEWLVKARFEAGGLRVKVPFLHKAKEKWDLYFLFVGLYPHADDMQFYCDTVWVLEQNGISIGKIRIVHLNAEYVREKNLDVSRLFTVSDAFYNANNNPTYPAKETIRRNMKDVGAIVKRMDEALNQPLPKAERKPKCASRQKCRCYELCFPEECALPDNSILNLAGAQYRYAMKAEGIEYLKDVDVSRIEGSAMQYAQIQADRNGGLYVDHMAMKNWLSHLSFPLSFIDFEWERYAIPPYRGMKPYDVLLFEYSLHILHEDGTLEHKSFLSIHDDRRELAESMINHVPKQGSVIAYNAIGAEMIRIRELATQFPDLSKELLAINDRMEDMQIPFVNGMIYDTRMKGNWSLKAIMSMMDDKGYKELDIQKGLDAVYQWRILDKDENPEQAEQIAKDLIAYCGMDTYAMVVVYNWMKRIV